MGIILKLIFKKSFGGGGMEVTASGLGQAVGCFECGDERWGSIKLAKFLDWARNYYLIKDEFHEII
jgi:hypothetical protein